MRREKNSEKITGFQSGIEPTTDTSSDALTTGVLRTLVTSRSFAD